MTSPIHSTTDQQYSKTRILSIWALSAIPMGLLAFVVAPRLVSLSGWNPLIAYWVCVQAGLVWQFILSMVILRREGYALSWGTMVSRCKYAKPVHPRTGRASWRLLWWTIPFIQLSAVIQMGAVSLPDIDGLIKPLIRDLPQYNLAELDPSMFRGAWWVLGLFLFTAVFNYFLGEELMYRGILLPKMKGAFGKWDWFVNGILFGFYHLHKPQVILSTALYFGFVFAFPSRLFQSSWMAAIIHGLEGVMGVVIIVGAIT